jgi:hypothetical protein
MLDKIRKLGAGELLLAVVVILGIIGTVSFFFFEDLLGEHKTTFIIASSLAFIGSFFVLSIYARAVKRKHTRQFSVKKDLANWMAYYSAGGRLSNQSAAMPQGTIEGIALHLYRMDGFKLASPASSAGPGAIHCMTSVDGQRELIQCWQEAAPLGLREVVRFYESLRAERAARGEIWSLSGFSDEARQWVAKKPIVLVGADQINEIAKGLFTTQRA